MAKVDPQSIRDAMKNGKKEQAAKLLGELCGHGWVQHSNDVIAHHCEILSTYKRHQEDRDLTLKNLCERLSPCFVKTQNEEYAAEWSLWIELAQSLGFDKLELEKRPEFWTAFKKASDETLLANR